MIRIMEQQLKSSNKRIAINTIIIYVRMILIAFIGLFTTRYVLQALGVEDYGLYNVVGGIVTMLTFISTAMITTTRRFLNMEMGKKRGGSVNKVFNVCLVLHIGFAILAYLIALTIGLWYINNVLNVSANKIGDAKFIYFISTTIAAIGIINVPYQALMTAFEKFKSIAIIDFSTTLLKIPLVVLLIFYVGNCLRFYAIGVCVISAISFICYQIYCNKYFKETVKWNFCRDINKYKEILYFNNYTSLGAFAYLARSQGAALLVNYIFGTIVNGAYAVAAQIESQIIGLVTNLGTAANPQLTQSYSSGNYKRTFEIVSKITKFSILSMIILCFSAFIEIETLLKLWLHNIPENTIAFSKAVLLSLFVRSLALGIDGLIQATGKVKWYQIIQSSLLVLGLPISFCGFRLGLPAYFIVVAFMLTDLVKIVAMFLIVCKVTSMNFAEYCKIVYIPAIKVMFPLSVYYIGYRCLVDGSLLNHLIGFIITLFVSMIVCFCLGLTNNERKKVLKKIS